MATSLRDNLTSAYLNAAHRMAPRNARRRIVAYVESYDDVAFWRTLLAEFEDDTRYFEVMLPSKRTLARGKKSVLMNTLNTKELGTSLIACVDSDYDYLLQGATAVSRKLNGNPYIFQTYGYAIENYQCYASSLHEVCVQATLNDRQVVDFPAFLARYSQTVYPLFLWNVWFYRAHDTNTFPMHEFNACTRLQDVDVRKPYQCLDDLARRVERKRKELCRRFPGREKEVDRLGKQLRPLGLEPDTTYLFIQGHHLVDGVVMRLLGPVCTLLRREREQEIKQLAGHREQLQNELTGYENAQMNVCQVLRKHSSYKGLFLYQWMRDDLHKFVEHL